ncbi:uncharacterized protein C5L36_0B06410 [Pichia kudriavzevii]|uniref:Ras GTPase-activating-like protein rng2 n=1 Tax=Pichia kudriavzevii TaxID=4909 RepID=A0A2U9R2J5_PICKU|nr:uncharacterized protein C5L36_0B06410 [Pichia kudriavzevii]AWU75396.1 hypothetical protein C5L36_0B06410 [Pichia kudriavzevii]
MSFTPPASASPRIKRAAEMLKMANSEEDDAFLPNPRLRPKQNEVSSRPATPGSPIKKSERPLNNVQKMILRKEQEAKENNASLPARPDMKPPLLGRRNIFVKQDNKIQQDKETSEDKMSTSEMGRMGKINTAMSASPSRKNLDKLSTIQAKLTPKKNEENSTSAPIILPKKRCTSSKRAISNNRKVSRKFSANGTVTNTSCGTLQSWIDEDRNNSKLLAFVCRMIEIKKWIEGVLNLDIGLQDNQIHEFPDYLTNGVLIAKLAQHFDPDHAKRIYENNDGYRMRTAQFKFTQNIVTFLEFTRREKLPSLFIFETNDLYEKKNIPKVIACLHALCCYMAMMGRSPAVDKIEEKAGVLEEHDFDVSLLNQIKQKFGRYPLGRKYIEGFEEAVRVNVGDDIKNLKLIQVEDPIKKPVEAPTEAPTEAPIDEPKGETPVEEMTEGPEEEIGINNELLSVHLVSADASSEHTFDSTFEKTTDETTEQDEEDNNAFLPPSEEEQQLTREARNLFNSIPLSVSLDSISEIQAKYRYMIDNDDFEFLRSSQFSTTDGEPEIEHGRHVINLQSLARGFLLRFDIFVTKETLRLYVNEVVQFQSMIRGLIAREAYYNKEMKAFGSSANMRLILKNRVAHARLVEKLPMIKEYTDEVSQLQNAIRGSLVREKMWKFRKDLLLELNKIIKLQSVIRGSTMRLMIKSGFKPPRKSKQRKPPPQPTSGMTKTSISKSPKTKQLLSSSIISTTSFDAPFEDDLFEKYNLPTVPQLPQPGNVRIRSAERQRNAQYHAELPILQSSERKASKLMHSPTKKKIATLPVERPSIDHINVLELQSSIRGMLTRIRLNKLIDELWMERDHISHFVARIKGVLVRKHVTELRKSLMVYQNEIIGIQSMLRGIESKVDYDCLVEDIHAERNNVILLQNIVRGVIVRREIREIKARLHLAEPCICRLQAIIKGVHGHLQYRSLVENEVPPLRVVQRHISLLSNHELDENAELIKLQEQIQIEKANVRKEIEKFNNLKIKMEILKKHGINIGNMMNKVQKNVDLGNDALDNVDEANFIKTPPVIEKSSNDLSLLLGKFFSILQTDSSYWSTILNYFENSGDLVELKHGNLEDWILLCFNYGEVEKDTSVEPNREEYYYMKLVVSTFKEYLRGFGDESLKKIIKNRVDLEFEYSYWEILIHAYTNLIQQRRLSKTILEDIIFIVTSDEEVSFEYDPSLIIQSLTLNDNERRILENGDNPFQVKVIERAYIQNMQHLRTTTTEIMKILKRKVNKLPQYIRCLLHDMYLTLKENTGLSGLYIMSLLGSIFMQCYILPIFETPENFSININAISDDVETVTNISRNLQIVRIVLNQIASSRKFHGSLAYLSSLNGYVEEMRNFIIGFIKDIIGNTGLNSYKKILDDNIEGFVKIKYEDIREVVGIWNQFTNEIIHKEDDVLKMTIDELKTYIDLEKIKEDVKLPVDKYGYTIIRLEEGVEIEGNIKQLVMERVIMRVKRFLAYILQVQHGDFEDLVDLLVAEIEPNDELRYLEIVRHEKKMNINNESHKYSYPQLKVETIKMLYDLQENGVTTSADGFQKIINLLADDIRHKRQQEKMRKLEAKNVVDTLTELKRRSRLYSKQYNEFERKIDDVLNSKFKVVEITKNESIFKFFRSSGPRKASKASSFGIMKRPLKELQERKVVTKVNDEFARSGFHIRRPSLVVECEKPGHFVVHLNVGVSIRRVSIEELIRNEYEQRGELELFDGLFVSSSKFLQLIIDTFYTGK